MFYLFYVKYSYLGEWKCSKLHAEVDDHKSLRLRLSSSLSTKMLNLSLVFIIFRLN
jgi:hypothetical protein